MIKTKYSAHNVPPGGAVSASRLPKHTAFSRSGFDRPKSFPKGQSKQGHPINGTHSNHPSAIEEANDEPRVILLAEMDLLSIKDTQDNSKPKKPKRKDLKVYIPASTLTQAQNFITAQLNHKSSSITMKTLEHYAIDTFKILEAAHTTARKAFEDVEKDTAVKFSDGEYPSEYEYKSLKGFIKYLVDAVRSRGGKTEKGPAKWVGGHTPKKSRKGNSISSPGARRPGQDDGGVGGDDDDDEDGSDDENPDNEWLCRNTWQDAPGPNKICGFRNPYSAPRCLRCRNARF